MKTFSLVILLLLLFAERGQASAGPSMDELAQFESALGRDGTNGVEQTAQGLFQKYPDPVDQGKIYYVAAMAFGQRGLDKHVREYAEYADKALACPLDDYRKLRLYIFYGDSILIGNTGDERRPVIQWRVAAAEKYLQCLRVALDAGIYFNDPVAPPVPERMPPELEEPMTPKEVERTRPLREAYQKKNSQYADAAYKYQRYQTLVPSRRLAYGHIVDIYSRFPFDTQELQRLATKILGNDRAVNDLVAVTQDQISKNAGNSIAKVNEVDGGTEPRQRAAQNFPLSSAPMPVISPPSGKTWLVWIILGGTVLAALITYSLRRRRIMR